MFQVNRVEDLSLLLFGYQHCLLVNSESDTADILGEFKKYCNIYFNSTEDHSWEKLIRLYSGSDSHSIKLFSQVFDDFLGNGLA